MGEPKPVHQHGPPNLRPPLPASGCVGGLESDTGPGFHLALSSPPELELRDEEEWEDGRAHSLAQ